MMFFPGKDTSADALPRVLETEEAALVNRVCEGEREAFDELYKRYSRLVHGIILARTPHREADDIVQDVFLTAFSKIGTLKDQNAFGAWIASIARRQAIDFFRKSRATEELTEDFPSGNPPSDEANEILAAIKQLPGAYNETLILRLVEGMTGPEISEMTGLTPDSVRVNLHRGMKLLRKRLGIED